MVFNRHMICGYFSPASHLGLMLNKYRESGQPMPVTVAIGVDPLSALVAASPFRIGEEEADFAGALAEKPVELIRCETNELLARDFGKSGLSGLDPDSLSQP